MRTKRNTWNKMERRKAKWNTFEEKEREKRGGGRPCLAYFRSLRENNLSFCAGMNVASNVHTSNNLQSTNNNNNNYHLLQRLCQVYVYDYMLFMYFYWSWRMRRRRRRREWFRWKSSGAFHVVPIAHVVVCGVVDWWWRWGCFQDDTSCRPISPRLHEHECCIYSHARAPTTCTCTHSVCSARTM